jgi:hypothetical protein
MGCSCIRGVHVNVKLPGGRRTVDENVVNYSTFNFSENIFVLKQLNKFLFSFKCFGGPEKDRSIFGLVTGSAWLI